MNDGFPYSNVIPSRHRSSMESDWQSDGPSGASTPITAAASLGLERATATTPGIHPTEFKVLILPDAVEEITKGGIIRPTSTTDTEKFATIEGRIVAISHLAFSYATAEEWGAHKPKPGNRVIFAKYAGMRRKGKDGVEYLLVNDKDIVATIED